MSGRGGGVNVTSQSSSRDDLLRLCGDWSVVVEVAAVGLRLRRGLVGAIDRDRALPSPQPVNLTTHHDPTQSRLIALHVPVGFRNARKLTPPTL